MNQQQCKVLKNMEIARDYYELEFTWDNKSEPKPGQFLTINPNGVPLLRRPFAFSSYQSGKAAIIYKKIGMATKGFSVLREGDTIDVLGPLGNPFTLPEKRPLLIAGGIGLGPMIFTANYLAENSYSPILVVGARDKSLIPELNLNSAIKVNYCTDDGSLGFKGNVAEFLGSQRDFSVSDCEIMACGPHIMLKACHEIAIKNNIECQVSLEEMMACAVGACYGCVVETTLDEKYKRVCKDGPVFNSRVIKWT